MIFELKLDKVSVMIKKIAKYYSNLYFFPTSVIALHFLTYFFYFYGLNSQKIDMVENLHHNIPFIFLLPFINYPNLLGCFLVFQLFFKNVSLVFRVIYVLSVLWDHISIFFDVMDNPDRGVPKLDYFFMFFRMVNTNGEVSYSFNLCITAALVHILIIWGRRYYDNMGR
jgi:hypothetical protein